MLAPLPRLHRMVVWVIVLASGLTAGVLLASTLPLPAGGLLVGSLAGCLVGFLLVHDFHRSADPARALRRR